ncbi:uncharacterized protein [Heptranchias perlo]|uniref:uncharacterized protein isoform X2 n=1 Tax=Heptranchias perlo TaxID=212740 RepID=UPI00355A35A4
MTSIQDKDKKPTFFLEGFLEKRRQTLKFNWRFYKFVLNDTSLCYYKVKNKPNPEGILYGKIDVRFMHSARETTTVNHNYPFEVVLANGKIIILSASTNEQRLKWLRCLWDSMHKAAQDRSRLSFGQQDKQEEANYTTKSSDEEDVEGDLPRIIKRSGCIRHSIASDSPSTGLNHMCRSKSEDCALPAEIQGRSSGDEQASSLDSRLPGDDVFPTSEQDNIEAQDMEKAQSFPEDTDAFINEIFDGITFNRQSQKITKNMMQNLADSNVVD